VKSSGKRRERESSQGGARVDGHAYALSMRIDGSGGGASRSARAARLVFAGAVAIGAWGCGSDPKGSATLSPGEFRSTDEGAGAPPAPLPVKTTTQSEAAAGFVDLTSLPGAPSTLAPAVTPTGEEVIVDQFIGQINGRAMMASEFFSEGFGDRLRAMGRQEQYLKHPELWHRETGQLVHDRLLGKIIDGLLLDEVYSAMSPEVKAQGLRFFLDQLRGDLVRNNAGSAQLADENLREKEGKTIDEVLRDRRDLALTHQLLQTKVESRVNVSWQQVVNEWERRNQERMDQGVARYRVITVTAANKQAVDRVKASVDGGTFGELWASELNEFKTDENKGYMTARYQGSSGQVKGFRTDINKAVQGLQPGQTVGPFTARESLMWLSLEGVTKDEVPPLYDAQLDILQQLKQTMSVRERDKYLQQLMEKSSLTPIKDMQQRLIAIAESRYAPVRGKP
jgi:hypothetical protein